MTIKQKNRVTFTHQLEGVERQLFFINENKDESLLLVLKNEDKTRGAFEFREAFKASGELDRQLTSRISIHNSDTSPGMLVKLTTEFSEKEKQKETNACFISDAKSKLFHLLVCKIYPTLGNKKYDISGEGKKVLTGRSRLIDLASLCVGIVLLGNDQVAPTLSWASLTVYKFQRYSIGIYCSYLNLMPRADGATLFYSTIKGGRGDGGIQSIEAQDLSDHLQHCFEAMAAVIVETTAKSSPPGYADELRGHPLWFHPNPVDLLMGRLQRNERLV